MKAIRLQARPGAPVHRLMALAAFAAVALVARAAEEQSATAPPAQEMTEEEAIAALFPPEVGQAAVWKRKETDFIYRSAIAPVSCTTLKTRVANILRALGARDDVFVRVDNCPAVVEPYVRHPIDAGSPRGYPYQRKGPSSSDIFADPNQQGWGQQQQEQRTHIRMAAFMPVALTPAVLDEIERDKSRRELISRVTGDPAASMNDPVVFPAKVQTITLSQKTDLEPVDCELIEQLTTALKRMDVRVVRRNFSCDRRSFSAMAPQVTFETLVGVRFDTKLPEIPEEEEGAAGEAPESSEPTPLAPASRS